MATTINAGRVRFVSRGTYNNSTQYYLFDLVDYNGSSYIAKENSLGNLPTNTQYWQLIAEKGNTGSTGQTGPVGATGNGIASITKTGTSGLVDTYTITYTNGNTTTFTVTNGEDGEVTETELDVLRQNDTELKNDISSINANIKANYYTKTETDTKLNKKQEKLTAGTGIEITGENTINNIQGNYSTEETKIGTWIDGKPLYRKTFNITSGFSTSLNIPHNISNIDYCKCYGTLIIRNISVEQFYASSTDRFRCFRDGDAVKIRYGTDNKPTTIIINLEYTKTTD